MRLSRFTDIGLRALMYMAAKDRRVSSREVAEAYDISKDHVTKSLQTLATLGVVESTPGRNGGFTLSAHPGDIRLGRLVHDLEPSLAMAECFTEGSTCPLTPSCDLADALARAQNAFFDSLNDVTLADLLVGTSRQLVQLTPPGR